MNPILTKKHWLMIGLVALVGGALTALAAIKGAAIWSLVLLCCTLVGIIAVREQALVIRHEDQRDQK